jgi:hypothetical protein
LNAQDLVSASVSTFRSLVAELSAEDDGEPEDDGLWLTIGYCSDRSHPYYGYIIYGHDDHPWLNGLYSGGCQVSAHSFAKWL